MMGHYILDENHQPVVCNDLLEFGRWFEDMDNRRVAETETEFHWVSTVFLGFDHNFSMNGPPVLFETMVFERQEHIQKVFGKDQFVHEELDCNRYCTWDQAKAGHAEMVMSVIRIEQQAAAMLANTPWGAKHEV